MASSAQTVFDPSTRNDQFPPFQRYAGSESFFNGEPPLSQAVGYSIILGFGFFFSILTTIVIYITNRFGSSGGQPLTSESFNTAGRKVKTGLTASVIVSQWTWAATLLQSSNVAWAYGVSGPFWYAAGATVQIILFGVLAVAIKRVAPSAHTVCEIVQARWGRIAHKTFLFFCLATNIIVTSMLLLGGAATVEALTGVDYRWASFLIPWGVIFYTASGGLQATFFASYVHTVFIFIILILLVFVVYVKSSSSDDLYNQLTRTASYTESECRMIFSVDGSPQTSYYEPGRYACGPVEGNRDGSYLTMISGDGFMFGVINVVGNFGTVFVDQSYWQSAIAARPSAAARGYVIAGLCWFAIPFCMASSLGLVSTALQLPITVEEASSGLVPPAVATELLGDSGSALILIMLFMAIVSTGSSESIAVSSLVAYDIYRQYINPEATGEQILFVSRLVIVGFGLLMGALSIALFELGLDLGWVYLFMGIMVGPAVAPLFNLMTWSKASGTGAVVAAWTGLVLGLAGWMFAAMYQSAELTIEALGTNEVMLTGNVVAILSSAFIHWAYSTFADPQEYDWEDLERKLSLVDEEVSTSHIKERHDPQRMDEHERWISQRGWLLTFILLVVWPLISIPAGVFSLGYFAFWVSVSVTWGFSAALVIIAMPVMESSEEIQFVLAGVWDCIMFRSNRPDTESGDTIGSPDHDSSHRSSTNDRRRPKRRRRSSNGNDKRKPRRTSEAEVQGGGGREEDRQRRSSSRSIQSTNKYRSGDPAWIEPGHAF